MHKVFISYHHANDQYYKNELLRVNQLFPMFIDASVDTGAISDSLEDQAIRRIIRDDYLRDSSVTILLAGTDTGGRKHVDWELYSSMIDGTKNKKSGILVITLPTTFCNHFYSSHAGEGEAVYPSYTSWVTLQSREDHVERYSFLPARILDNLANPEANISVVQWDTLAEDWSRLIFLIEATYKDRASCNYDLSSPMRRKNSNP